MLLAVAGYLAIALGIIHSILGEWLIFSRWRKAAPDIPRQHRGIIWASWHELMLFGAVIGIILIRVPLGADTLILVAPRRLGTCWRHPGWAVLTVLDEYTREALCVHVRARMGSADVL